MSASVDAGMIAAFLAFGEPSSPVFVSVLAYRVIAFWLPIPPGIIAYLQLRQTVARWREEDAPRSPPPARPARRPSRREPASGRGPAVKLAGLRTRPAWLHFKK